MTEGPSAQGAPVVTVDFNQPRQVNSASGYLFGITTATPADRVAPTRPRLVRYSDFWTPAGVYQGWGPLAQAFRAAVPDVELNFLLTTTAFRTPWVNWATYDQQLTSMLTTLKNAGLTAGAFEVWNEPDFPVFWSGTRAQFHETYLRGYQVIRRELGSDVPVGGPSLGVYNHQAIEAFLEYCLANGCEVNDLIFHANDDSPGAIAAYPLNVQDAQTSFVENPRYAPLKIRRILNNEIGGPIYTRQPAGTLAHYAAFEAAGAAAAARACWDDSLGASDCFNGTLDGLLTPGTFQPRAVWWAHKYYVDGVPERVASTVSTASLVALASRATGAAAAQVLVGHVDFTKSLNKQPGTLSSRLVLVNIGSQPAFAGAQYVAARIESIPATGEAALAAPSFLEVVPAPIVGGTAEVVLPPIGVGGVLRVTLEPLNLGTPGPPVISTPADRTVSGGTSTTFVVTAAGNPSPSLQWQISTNGGTSWSNVQPNATFSDVTAATLQVANITSSLNGARFRCVATNSMGSATSGAATLTVASLNLSRDLVALGIAGQNAIPGNPLLDARPLFKAGIAYAMAHHLPHVTVDPGHYYFLTPDDVDRFLNIWGATDLTIDLSGSTIFLKTGFLHGIILTDCARVTLKNFTIDYVTPPYTHATLAVMNPAGRNFTYSTVPGFADPASFNGVSSPYGPLDPWVVVFRNGAIVPGTSRMRVQSIASGAVQLTGDDLPWLQPATLGSLRAGDTIVLAPRGGGSPVEIFRGDAIVVSNVTVHGSSNWAVTFDQASNSIADGVRILPRPGTGLVSSNAEGIRFTSSRQNNQIKNATVRRTLDDAIVMDSLNLATVLHQAGPRHLRVRRNGWWRFPNGTSVNVVKPDTTLEWGGGVIVSQNPPDGDVFGAEIDLAFDRDLPALTAGDYMVFGTSAQRGAGSKIADNVVSDIPFGRGIWLGGNQGVTIERNQIGGTSSGGIVLSQTTGGPFAPPAADIVVQDNQITGVLGPMASGSNSHSAFAGIVVHSLDRNGAFGHATSNHGITLRRNTITDSGRGGIWLGQTDGALIENNTIVRWNRFPNWPVVGLNQEASGFAAEDFVKAIAVRLSANVTQSGNVATGDPAVPSIVLDRNAMAFGAASNGSALVAVTPAQNLRVLVNASTPLAWTATSNQPWLRVQPESGTGTSTLSVSVLPSAALPPGAVSGTISIALAGGGAPVGHLTVSLSALLLGTTASPFGSFDTPLEGTTGVAGSIAVTGWAVDDIGITGVRIMREPVGGEPPGQLVFIGNAVFVEGARADIVAAFPSMPAVGRSGWGYLMLTNFLPNQGNGTFTLHAIADDADGHSISLGTRTITCANGVSMAPFGAIDTPAQGETVSGTINNFGWTLIRGFARADTPGGGTVQVLVDGAPMGSPVGWASRPDLTALFPTGFSALESALAVFPIDTTTLANGVHTIAWIVTATNGESAGIGSRYFTVSNGASLLAAPAVARIRSAQVMAHTPEPAEPGMLGRRGFDLEAPYASHAKDADGVIVIQSEELDRIELRTGARSGSLITPEGPAALPVGSRFDAGTGVFTWLPGVGFVGAYDFLFAGRRVRIVLNPRGR